jgi:hypothetical protein
MMSMHTSKTLKQRHVRTSVVVSFFLCAVAFQSTLLLLLKIGKS